MKQTKVNPGKAIGLVILLCLTACDLFRDTDTNKTANEYVYDIFKEWYLWYDQTPTLDPDTFATTDALIKALKVDQDRWSYAGSLTDIQALLESGEYKGFGAGFMIDYDNQIKLSKVYSSSPLGLLGAERGWVVVSVNGFTVDDLSGFNQALSSDDAVDFVFIDNEGQTRQFTTSRSTIQMNTVLYSQVYEMGSHKIGYLVFDSFLETSVEELTNVVQAFSDQQITDLIIDLRYNGGGLNSTAETLVGMLGGAKVHGKVIASRVHNDKKAGNNASTVSNYNGVALDLDSLCFITTSGTASASELVINCLKPFMNVTLVGSTTNGKPVGMYVLKVETLDLAVLPICFNNLNNLGEGNYFNGMTPDYAQTDDLSHNWGDESEGMLHAAITAITGTGNLNATNAVSPRTGSNPLPFEYNGLHQLIQAY